MTLELNDYGNAPRASAVRAAVEAEGGVFTIWLTRTFTAAQARQACIESGTKGFIAEGEIPGHRPEAQNWAELAFALEDLPIDKAVATNFAPFVHADGSPWPEKARPLIDAGWKCLTECYLSETPSGTPEARHHFATHLGWIETQPILGIYGGKTMDDYPTRDRFRAWSVWGAEYVL